VTQTSRALNGHTDVAPATRQRAEAAARRLGYVPNQEARRLQNPDSRSGSLGLILVGSQRFSDPFFGTLLTDVVDEATRRGYELQLSAPAGNEDPTVAYDRALLTKSVDGFLILRATRSDSRARFLAERSFPFVTFGQVDDLPDDPGCSGAVVEHPDSLLPAIEHLVALGHRHVGFLHEPLENCIGWGRLRSFRRAVDAHQIEVPDAHVVAGGFRDDTAKDAALALLTTPDRPTALVTSNDLQAIGVLRAAEEAGLRVPDELAVVGFDDIAAAAHTSPPLTTLRHAEGTIGGNLVDRLLATINSAPGDGHLDVREQAAPGDRDGARTVLAQPELVVRASTDEGRRHRGRYPRRA
jgi:LacI family transcriptional regulator